jgi:hypothetical protein
MQFKEHKWVYIVIIAALIVLGVFGAARYHQKKVTEESTAKATEFVAALQKAGFDIKDEGRAVQRAAEAFGTDGGDLLADPESAYYHALANFQLGNGGALSRPGILDDDVFVAEYIALQVYRGDQAAAEFKDWYAEMKFADVIEE